MLLEYYARRSISPPSPPTSCEEVFIERFLSLLAQCSELSRKNLYLALSGSSEAHEAGTLWNSLVKSDEYCAAVISCLPLPEQIFSSMLEKLREIKGLSGDEGYATVNALAQELKLLAPATGFKVAEIGGFVTAKLLRPLGALVSCADAGYVTRHGINRIAERVENPELIVNQSNYREWFPEQYDLTCSRMLLTRHSGIEALAPDAPNDEAAFQLACRRLLSILRDVSKEGALCLHAGMDSDATFLFREAGFRIVKRFEYEYQPARQTVLAQASI